MGSLASLRRSPRLLVLTLAGCLGAAPAARGQGAAGSSTPAAGLSSTPRAATAQTARPAEASDLAIDALVTDEDGRLLGGLKQDNFRISDNGRELPVTSFALVDTPVTIVMLLEYSGLAYSYFAYKGAAWGSDFLSRLEPEDYVALVTYDIKPTVREDFTRNKAAVRQALNNLSYPSFREANLHDAMLDTLERLQRVRGKKSILLISTGTNTFSSANFSEVQKQLRESEAAVYAVGIGEGEFLGAEMRGQLGTGGKLNYLQSKNQMTTLAKMSGGHAWFPRFQGELPSIFDSVAAMLRNQYRLEFSPPARDGKYHKLKVNIVGADGKPLRVTNEKGKQRKVVVYAREGYVAPKTGSGP